MGLRKSLQKFSYTVFSFLDLVRYWDWFEVIRTFSIAAIVLMAFTDSFKEQIFNVTIVILYHFMVYPLGVLVNSHTDRATDLSVGKDYFKHYSKNFRKALIGAFGFLSVAVPFIFLNVYILISTYIGIFLLLAYSLKPLRLKERGLYGLMAATIAQGTPFTYFFFFLPSETPLTAYLYVWLLLMYFIIELSSQIRDFKDDAANKIATFAVRLKIDKALSVLYGTTVITVFYLSLPLFTLSLRGVLLTTILYIFSQVSFRYAQQQISVATQKK